MYSLISAFYAAERRGIDPPGIKAAFLINRKVGNSAIGREIAAALSSYDLPVLKTAIGQRVAFAESSAGYSVLETAPTGLAAKEVQALGKEVLKLLGSKKW